jgi:hypothetical protein
MKVYVSGPMTGIEDFNYPAFNYPAFHDARDALKAAGHEVVSPADIPLRDDWDWIDYILVDIVHVFNCDGVATLPGCETSKGSRIECLIAQERGIPVRPLEEWLAEAAAA